MYYVPVDLLYLSERFNKLVPAQKRQRTVKILDDEDDDDHDDQVIDQNEEKESTFRRNGIMKFNMQST